MKRMLCTHMEGLAKAWARFPSVNVADGDLALDCHVCNVRVDVSVLLKEVARIEKEIANA